MYTPRPQGIARYLGHCFLVPGPAPPHQGALGYSLRTSCLLCHPRPWALFCLMELQRCVSFSQGDSGSAVRPRRNSVCSRKWIALKTCEWVHTHIEPGPPRLLLTLAWPSRLTRPELSSFIHGWMPHHHHLSHKY